MAWGMYGDEPPCGHLLALRQHLTEARLSVYSETGMEPAGWVNVYCAQCGRTYETVLREPWEDDPDAAVYTGGGDD